MALENKLGLTSSADLAREEERISKKKAVALFEAGLLDQLEAGTFSSLQFIHKYLFEDIYDFAGELRTVNIAKGNFRFAPVMYLEAALSNIEKMPQSTFDEIIEKREVCGDEYRPPLPGRQRAQHPHLAGSAAESRASSGGRLEPRG